MHMEVRSAIQTAKSYILELFEDEPITQIGLEELEFIDLDATWEVTVGFQRGWNSDSSGHNAGLFPSRAKRIYKTLRIRDDGSLISLKHRDVSVPA